MNRERYVQKFCIIHTYRDKELGDSERFIITMDGCYLYSGNSQKRAIEACNIIDFFIKHSIFQVESTFEKDEHFPYPVANIGYSELENKWYGWSHIAIFGFIVLMNFFVVKPLSAP